MKLKYIFLAFLTLFMASCNEEWLELSNPNLQTTETFWQSEADVKAGVSATYMGLLYDGTWLRFVPFALSLKGDDIQSFSPWRVLSLTGKFNLDEDPIMAQWPWTAFYGVINRANQVLENIDNVEFANQATYDQYKGEALFLRGLSNYYLVSFFRNIPLVMNTYQSEEDLYPEQVSPEVAWAAVIDDFKAAADLLPTTYPETDLGRATKGAALAFVGKSYLMNHDYENASNYLKQVIDLGVYNLVPNYADNFTTSNENNSESIFEIQLDRNVGGTVLGWVSQPAADWSKTSAHAITFAPTGYGFGDAAATRWIFDEYMAEKTVDGEVDPRATISMSYDTTACTMYGTPFREAFDASRWDDVYIRKYTNAFSTEVANEFDWRSDINERVMRYAEVLMMYAECQYELGNAGVAGQYIQMVRDRSDLADISADIASMGREEFYNQLSHDKVLEFAFEGIRFEDIVRWGWLYNADRLQELKDHDSEFSGFIEGREYFPIPPAERDKNPNYTQNPGWGI
ncbi:RagB/SusD family nutrient uptake outer membrane protein [Draconibacterium sediminis]|uniref:Glycan metabolism protein RagB n=1 Tax=Draconibacterium sediminis TaxID=1544798 RepID=A0A0D8J8K2_9BACT|nr:RagB/SusD family nutrient uptake outer membrane protein [Draconibacterium sediminis]KJF42133.1 hypothetical protein LH29_20150 [Draconibacterium sediminis]